MDIYFLFNRWLKKIFDVKLFIIFIFLENDYINLKKPGEQSFII